MALQLKGTVKIHNTGKDLGEAYVRIITVNNADGTQEAKLSSYVTREHFKNIDKLRQLQVRIPLDFGFTLEKVETADLAKAHEAFKKQFAANKFKVEIVDL